MHLPRIRKGSAAHSFRRRTRGHEAYGSHRAPFVELPPYATAAPASWIIRLRAKHHSPTSLKPSSTPSQPFGRKLASTQTAAARYFCFPTAVKRQPVSHA